MVLKTVMVKEKTFERLNDIRFFNGWTQDFFLNKLLDKWDNDGNVE